MKALVLALALAALAAGIAGAAPEVTVRDGGSLVVKTPGKQDVATYLFLWYDRWIWRELHELTRIDGDAWQGSFAKREEDGPGRILFTQSVTREGDALRLTYEFERDGDMELTRGIYLSFYIPFPDYEGGDVVFTHGPPKTTADNFETAARGCTLALSETAALEVATDRASTYRLRADPGRRANLFVRLVPSDFGERARASLTLRIVPAMEAVRPWRALPRKAPLRLADVTADSEVFGLYEPVEFTLDLSATYDNPFDPDDVAVEAVFVTPSGRTERLAGFYYQGFEAEYEGGLELLSLRGDPEWKVRYAPREIGEHRVTFRARDRSGEVESPPIVFRCDESGADGFVRISDAERAGPRYFRFDAGRSLFLIGHNVTTYAADVDRVFRKMSDGGENYTRFWMWSQGLSLEWGLPVGHYRTEEAWRLDRTLDLAKQHGIWLMLCLDTHQDFLDSWRDNPYNSAAGGPCKEVMGFFTDERARSLYKKRLRYLIARWGYHPNLLCWEFVNEIEGWRGAAEHKDQVAAWHVEMARTIGETDPFDHPITTSQWTTEGWPELWDLPEMDFVQSHYYANSLWADMAGDVAGICRQKLRDYGRKLHVFGEYGISSGAGTRRMDPAGVHLHNGNWAALVSGCASNPVSWWHDSYIDALDLYSVCRGLSRFVEGEPLADRAWRVVEADPVVYTRPLQQVLFKNLRFTPRKGSWEAPVPEGMRFTIGRDGTVANHGELPNLLHGSGHQDLRSPFVFEVDCRKPSRFNVQVGTVSAGGILEFRVDGKAVRTVELPAGEGLGTESRWQERWQIWQTDYNETYGVELPPGPHVVELTNEGRDWVDVEYFELTDYVTNELPPLRVLCLASDDRALVWAQNEAHTWFNVRAGEPVPPVEPTSVRLTGFADGVWQVESWDTVKGEVIARSSASAADGQLELQLPRIETDVALKLLAQ